MQQSSPKRESDRDRFLQRFRSAQQRYLANPRAGRSFDTIRDLDLAAEAYAEGYCEALDLILYRDGLVSELRALAQDIDAAIDATRDNGTAYSGNGGRSNVVDIDHHDLDRTNVRFESRLLREAADALERHFICCDATSSAE